MLTVKSAILVSIVCYVQALAIGQLVVLVPTLGSDSGRLFLKGAGTANGMKRVGMWYDTGDNADMIHAVGCKTLYGCHLRCSCECS